MALQQFVDLAGPPIRAAWLNMVDVLATTVFGSATTPAAARVALTTDAAFEIANGGTSARTAAAARASLTSDNPLEVANGGTGVRAFNPLSINPTYLVKTTNLNITSSGALANDPQLTVAITVAGSYLIDAMVPMYQAAAGAAGISANINYSGTIVNANSFLVVAATSGIGTIPESQFSYAALPTTSIFSMAEVSHIAGIGFMRMKGIIAVSTIGNLGFAAAQNTPGVNTLTIPAGSFMIVQRVL